MTSVETGPKIFIVETRCITEVVFDVLCRKKSRNIAIDLSVSIELYLNSWLQYSLIWLFTDTT